MKAPKKKYKLVRVFWEDAHSNARWLTAKDAKEWANDTNCYMCENVGYLIEKTDKGIVLAARISDDGDLGLLQRIPKKWVTKVVRLDRQKRKVTNKTKV